VPPERVVFVSHAYADRTDLVAALKSFFEKCGLGDSSYFISSLGDQITWGRHDLDQIYEHLDTARIFIDLITPVFLTRPRCLAEIGYATALERSIARMHARQVDPQTVGLQASIDFLPMVVPPLTPDDVAAHLDRRQSPVLDDPATVAAFCEQFRKLLAGIGIDLEPTKFRNAVRTFQRSWQKALASRSEPGADQWDAAALKQLERRHSSWLSAGRDFDLLPGMEHRAAWFASLSALAPELQRFLYEGALHDSKLFEHYEAAFEDKSSLADVMVRYSAASGVPTRPKYRLAYAAQYWAPEVKRRFCDAVLGARARLAGPVRDLLQAIEAGTVVPFVEDERAAWDLRSDARADLLTQFARYEDNRGQPSAPS
jgi:hypothetical protein